MFQYKYELILEWNNHIRILIKEVKYENGNINIF